MAELFDAKTRDLKNLKKIYKKAPKKLQRTTANVLNSFAFGTRKEILKLFDKKITIRNKRFVASSIRVEKASGSDSISNQKSITGSIKRDRFSGWIEQQTGKKREKTRVGTLLSRGSDFNKNIRPAARMKPGKDFPASNDFPGKSKQQRTIVMLNTLKKKKFKRPFKILKGHRKFKPGLYKFLKGKVKRLQTFESETAQPKRMNWMNKSRRNYFRKNNARKIWLESLNRIFKLK